MDPERKNDQSGGRAALALPLRHRNTMRKKNDILKLLEPEMKQAIKKSTQSFLKTQSAFLKGKPIGLAAIIKNEKNN